jgi:hypothetical protein
VLHQEKWRAGIDGENLVIQRRIRIDNCASARIARRIDKRIDATESPVAFRDNLLAVLDLG